MDKTLGQLLQEIPIDASKLADVQVEPGKLEDVFVHLTREEAPQ
jgi:hypothetical protein